VLTGRIIVPITVKCWRHECVLCYL